MFTAPAGIRFSLCKVLKKMDKEISGNYSAADVETLLATLCYLMSRHAEHPTAELANIISDHFSMMQSHPDCQSGILKDLGKRLGFHWHKLAVSGTQKNTNLVH